MGNQQKGKDFEDVVKNLYEQIAQNDRIKAQIKTRVQVLGVDGATNEIDVLYSYEHLGLKYRVAIECKNWKKPVNVEELRNFSYKLNDIKNINGIFISADSGYQKGAKKVSEFNGIKIVKYSDFSNFISGEYEDYLSPDFEIIGDPFWMLMNKCGKNSIEQNLIDGTTVLLFESKKMVTEYKNMYFKSNDNIRVAGVSQDHLKELLRLQENKEINVSFLNIYKYKPGNHIFNFIPVDSSILQMYIR